MTENKTIVKNTRSGLELAVIGMAGKFPGAKNIHEYWENLKKGVESIVFFSDEELEKAGIASDLLENPNYVKAYGFLEDVEYFDVSFFGYTPKEAEIMNPQMRIFHEYAWHALEDAGYSPESYDGSIGVYAGASSSFHWEGLSLLSGKSGEVGGFAALQLTDITFLSTRISYKFNLKGPSSFVQTACSTSLVAIHWACRSVLSGECDMALAGGIGLNLNQRRGHMYEEGMILSPDGHCRAFDTRAKGTVGGNGVGIVVLKRLKNAIMDRDHIYAIIKGTAINNDGNRKVGYTAPSVQGQVEVIQTAQAMARVEPESIGYIETHGTGTVLGDPVEIEALTMAFNTDKRNFCPIGSVKTNIGHLDTAAGVAGFIKTVLALKNKVIPPSLHFKEPNPAIDYKNSPFYVNTQLKDWKNDQYPLRAGVSSFGIGGTNAHVVLEEAPQLESASPARPFQLILLSANTQSALDKKTGDLAEHLNKNPGINLADAAYTMQVGRKAFPHRRMAVCSSVNETIEALTTPELGKVRSYILKHETPSIVFMFSGQGSQYVNMGLDLYRAEPIFREEIDRCFEILKPLMDHDIKEILYPSPVTFVAKNNPDINQTENAQPVLFVIEYALAKLLMKWGITPGAMIGHSIGEYTSACLSGVFSLEDALKIVVLRGKLMQKMPPGTMLSIPLTEEELTPLLNNEISLAAVNSSSYCVVSGNDEAIDSFEIKMKKKGYDCTRLQTTHAFHSEMMNPILEELEKGLRQIKLNKPKIPYISNLTGKWITAEETTNPRNWCCHLRETVRFSDGISELLKKGNVFFLEIGPGKTLSTFVRNHKNKQAHQFVINLIRHPKENIPGDRFLLTKIGQLWLYGVTVDWEKFHEGEERHRIPLPTYPFEGQKYWLGSDSLNVEIRLLKEMVNAGRKTDIADWYYIPSWKRTSITTGNLKQISAENTCCWLVFVDKCGIGIQLMEKLKKAKQHVITVQEGMKFSREKDIEFTIQPGHDSDYEALFTELSRNNKIPDKIVHLWGVTTVNQGDKGLDPAYVDAEQKLGFFSLLSIAWALGKQDPVKSIEITVVTNNMQEVNGEDGLCPGKTTVLGPVKSIPNEYPNIKCRSIDLSLSKEWSLRDEEPVRQLFEELTGACFNSVVAYRNFHRWEQTFEPIRLGKPPGKSFHLRQEGVYLVIGGLGGIGLLLAEHLAKTVRAKLVLTGRSPLPAKDEWQRLLNREVKDDDGIKDRIQRLKALEDNGAEVLVLTADVTDEKQMRSVIHKTLEKFSRVNGVIHSAGLPDGELIRRKKRKTTEKILAAKVRGTLLLDRILKDIKLDFFVLCSSIVSIQAGIGQVAYCAANNFLDAFAKYKFYKERLYTVSINWDRWRQVGMATIAERMHKNLTGEELAGGISHEQGLEAFDRILDETLAQVAVTPLDPMIKIEQAGALDLSSLMENIDETKFSQLGYQRPDLETEYIAPRYELEQKIAEIWANFFGFQQVGIRDDFFELGGDSLRAMVMASKIHKELNIEIPIQEFFNSPTIEGLAGYINHKTEKNVFVSIGQAEEKEYYPLASAQKRLYIIQQMELKNKSYNQPSMFMLEGELDRDRFEGVFRELIKRHEGLRTSFKMIKGEPVQRIHDEVKFEIEYYDAGCKAQSAERKEERHALYPGRFASTINRFIRPFDLSDAPLLRVGLIEIEPQKHLIMVDMHHIIADGTSIEIFRGDFMAIYGLAELPPLRLRYRDFSEWQNQSKEKQEAKQHEAFWLKEFAKEIPVLNLPWDYPRPVVQSFEGGEILFDISAEETHALNEMARKEGVTLFMVLLAIYNIFLSKLSGQEDIVVGVPIAGRRHADLEKIIGMFVNTLSLLNYPGGDRRFKDFLGEVKERTLRAFENQEYPFEELVDKLSVKRDIGRNPLFDIMFVLQNMNTGFANRDKKIEIEASQSVEADSLKKYENIFQTTKFDLTLMAIERGGGLFLSFQYCAKLFKKETVERFIVYFKKIVSIAVKDRGIKISEIEIISDEEKNQILNDFNQTETEYPRDKTIHRLFEEQVERTPENIAVVAPSIGSNHKSRLQITYNELNEKSGQLAYELQTKGLGPDAIVGIMVERSVEMIFGILGILKSGSAYLPIDLDHPQERIKFMLEESGAAILLTRDELMVGVGNRFALSNFPSTSSVSSGAKNSLPAISWAYLIYTSGTTGKPKGVVITHQNLANYVCWFTQKAHLTPHDKAVLTSSFAFDLGYTSIYPALLNGCELHVLPREIYLSPGNLLDYIYRKGITYIKLTPSLLKIIVDSPDFSSKRCSSLLLAVVGGEAIDLIDIENAHAVCGHLKIMNHYGPTEATIGCIAQYINFYRFEEYKMNPTIGKPIANARAYILDKNLNLLPVGVPGELCISGAGVGMGYLNRSELTAEKFVINYPLTITTHQSPITLYKSGDLAKWLPDGNIEFLGRIDHQVKIRGYRIELGEIEAQLLKCPGIDKAVVVDRETGDGKKSLWAYLVSEKKLGVTELRSGLSKALPDYMIPSYFIGVEKIPLTLNGKIDLEALYSLGIEMKSGEEYEAPRNEIEKKIVELWKEVLNREKVGVSENFFDIGGTSLDIVRLNVKFKEVFNEEESVVQMFRYPTIRSFGEYLIQRRDGIVSNDNIHRPVPINKIKQTRQNQKNKRIKGGIANG